MKLAQTVFHLFHYTEMHSSDNTSGHLIKFSYDDVNLQLTPQQNFKKYSASLNDKMIKF